MAKRGPRGAGRRRFGRSGQVVLTALLVVLAAGCATAGPPARSGVGVAPTGRPSLDELRWATVEAGGPTDRFDLPGLVVAEAREVVVAPIDARVVGVDVRPGTAVERGQVVATLVPTTAEVEEVQRLAVALDAAIAAGDPAATIGELVAARADAIAQLRAAPVSDGGEPGEVVAETAGVVVQVLVTEGQAVTVGQPIVSVGAGDALEVHVVVPDELLPRLDGDDTELTVLDAGSLGPVAAGARAAPAARRIVSSGDPAGTTTIRIELIEPDGAADRDRVRVEAILGGDDAVLAVPTASLRTLDRQPFVLTEQDGQLTAVEVEVRTEGAEATIVDGELAPGDRVALP